MRALEISNLRCFRSTGNIQLAPLTLLVGENSTGKSTFMAGMRLAWDAAFGEKAIEFNEDPFLLGAYDQIARYPGGKGGRAAEFRISTTYRSHREKDLRVTTSFGRHRSQPVMVKQVLETEGVHLNASVSGTKRSLQVRADDQHLTIDLDEGAFRLPQISGRLVEWDGILWRLSKPEYAPAEMNPRFAELWTDFFRIASGNDTRPFALAPVRTKPFRTYDPLSETPTAEGSHIPILLDQLYFRDREQWLWIKGFLEGFGRESGLFRSLQIKPLGKGESEPFQIRVKIAGPPTNLIDVGYGVSQILPIALSALLQPAAKVFLFQQPEVHLHPRAQAELSGLFRNLLKPGYCSQLIAETHSDHLIDRVRADVRDGLWKPEDVTLLFFERKRVDVKIHRIDIDEMGNLVGAPPGYRKFFLEEEERLLGI